MKSIACLLLAAAALAAPAPAEALPRFAARNGSTCLLCHINPTGGGVRNDYGRNVFERIWLPWSARPRPQRWVAEPPPDAAAEPAAAEASGPRVTFDPQINEWLTLGGDFRTAYIYIRPDRGPLPGSRRDITSSFFLMQADLYTAATLNDRVTLVVDVGVYSGFEAWGLIRLTDDLMIKVGRFLPPFGIREVEHQLYTRDGIGAGNVDRDTGVELTGLAGPLTAHLAVLNGTLGDTAFDSHGSQRRRFENAMAARVGVRTDRGWVRAELGGSLYYNRNGNQANPLFGGVIPIDRLGEVSAGVDELRAGGFFTANLGRFTYMADLAHVRDTFASDALGPLAGYASYQELSFIPEQGLELIGTFEFADPDLDILHNSNKRAGLAVELFPWPFTELRAMVRRSWSETSPTGGAWDAVLFTHLFM